MTTPHPHKDILIAIANGLSKEQIEVHHKNWEKNSWQPAKAGYDGWLYGSCHDWKVRIKQKTVMFNGIELPEPLKEMPAKYQTIYLADPANKSFYASYVCNDAALFIERWLKQGLLHANKENAIAWAKAMIPFQQNT